MTAIAPRSWRCFEDPRVALQPGHLVGLVALDPHRGQLVDGLLHHRGLAQVRQTRHVAHDARFGPTISTPVRPRAPRIEYSR